MMDYEIIGRITAWLGTSALLIICAVLLLKGAWFAVKEIYGWPRIAKALRLLREKEAAEDQLMEDMT